MSIIVSTLTLILFFQVFFKSGNEAFILEQRYIEAGRNQHDHSSESRINRFIFLIEFTYDFFLQLGSELAEKAIEKPIDFKITPDSLSNAKDVC